MTVVPYLTTSKLAKTITGQQELVNLVAERAEIDSDFDASDEDSLACDKVIMCVDTILNLFNVGFILYYVQTCIIIYIIILGPRPFHKVC